MKSPNCSVVRRLWGLAGVAGVVIVTLAIRAALGDEASEPKSATAILRVGNPPQMDRSGPRDATAYEQYRKTQAQLIRSDLVLSGALREEGVLALPVLQASKESPKQWLQDHVTVIAPLGTELLEVKLRGEDPAQAVKIVNAVVDSYVKNVVNAERGDLLHARDTLEAKLREMQEVLA